MVVVMVMVLVPVVVVRVRRVAAPRVEHVQHERGAQRQPRAGRLLPAVRQFDQQGGHRGVRVAGRLDRQRSDVAEPAAAAAAAAAARLVRLRLLLGRVQHDRHERERPLGHVQHLHHLLSPGPAHVGRLKSERKIKTEENTLPPR